MNTWSWGVSIIILFIEFKRALIPSALAAEADLPPLGVIKYNEEREGNR